VNNPGSELKTESATKEYDGHGAGRTNRFGGRILVVVAAVLWSSSGFFAKAPIFADWPIDSRGAVLAFWRGFFAAAVLIFFVRKVQWTWRLLPMVTVFALMNWTYLNGMVHCESSLAIWLQYTAPAWVFPMAWLLWREKPRWADWVLLIFATLGVGVILQAELLGASAIGVRYGLGSGLFFACVVICLRGLRDVDAAWLIFLNQSVTAIVFAPAALTGEVWPDGNQWIYLALFGSLQMGLPYVLFARGLQSVSSHEASGIALLEPVLVPVWVYVAWRGAADYQLPAVTTMIGAVLIMAGLLASYWPNKKPLSRPEASTNPQNPTS
jgi:drug/metabolite transporter (DMT)-like permease